MLNAIPKIPLRRFANVQYSDYELYTRYLLQGEVDLFCACLIAFSLTKSSNLTCVPPNISNALGRGLSSAFVQLYRKPMTHLPYVKSTRPFDKRSTNARSEMSFAPPAYVVGIVAHSPSSMKRERHLGLVTWGAICAKSYWSQVPNRCPGIDLQRLRHGPGIHCSIRTAGQEILWGNCVRLSTCVAQF